MNDKVVMTLLTTCQITNLSFSNPDCKYSLTVYIECLVYITENKVALYDIDRIGYRNF